MRNGLGEKPDLFLLLPLCDHFVYRFAGLESLAASLEEAAPYFKFSTSARIAQKDSADGKVKKGDTTGVWENWHGSKDLLDYVPPEPEGHSDDQSGEATSPPPAPPARGPAGRTAAPPAANGKKPTPPANRMGTKKPEPPPQETEEVKNEDGSSPFDLDELEQDALSDSDTSTQSGNQLIALAVEAGMPEKEAKEAKTWTPVIAYIRENHDSYKNNEEGEQQTEEEEQQQGWSVGDECMYRPIDPGTKKPVKTPVKCTVKAVNEDKGTVTLQSGKASYKDVPMDKIDPPTA